MTHRDLPETVYTWGKAILVTGALAAGIITFSKKAIETVQAGPEAKADTEILKIRVTKLEHQSRFLVRGMEQLVGRKYGGDVSEGAADAR